MSDSYLDVFSADRAITALASRVRPVADDDVIRALGSWVESVDADLPDPATNPAPVTGIDVGRRSLRITALVVAGVLGLMSTGVAFAVGDHPFAPIERVVRHVIRPAKVEPLGAPPADESSAVGAQPSGSGSASGLDGRVGGAQPGGAAAGHRSPTANGQALSGLAPQTEAISTTIIEISPTLVPMPTIGPSIPLTIYTEETPTNGTASPTSPPTSSPDTTPPPSTEPPSSTPPSTDPPSTTPPSTDPPSTTPPSTDPPSTTPPSTDPPSTTPPSTDSPSTTPPSTNSPSTTPASTEPAPTPGSTTGGSESPSPGSTSSTP
jgi:hypothetical protein